MALCHATTGVSSCRVFGADGGTPKLGRAHEYRSPSHHAAPASSWSKLSPVGFKKIQETAARLGGYHIDAPSSERDLALHRFYSGAARTDAADAVLDFVIALESLLLPYDENARLGDLGYRFRMHGAHYLARKRSQRAR